jgi:2-keto-4-pentenoate hydratase/2-oxohepta-3-ene-1,7-dioic acid hydratase in catechol pathway
MLLSPKKTYSLRRRIMKFARIGQNTLDGIAPRLVIVQPEQQRVIDLVTAERRRLERQGATGDAALRLATALFPSSMTAALSLGDLLLTAAKQAIESAGDDAAMPLSGVHLLSPLDPPLIRDFTAFEQHMQNMSARLEKPIIKEFFEMPLYYKGNPSTLIAHEQEVPWPEYTKHMDYELELGFVIGKGGRNLTPQEALSHLFGVTIFNDFSARDIQGHEMSSGFGPAKGKDFATALGPWIATSDELDLEHLGMVARINGEEWSHGSSVTMTWKIEELIAYASRGEMIWPGELLGSGTVGFGCGAEFGRMLQPGDVVELEVQGIGILRNRIGQPEPRGWKPEPRTSSSKTE